MPVGSTKRSFPYAGITQIRFLGSFSVPPRDTPNDPPIEQSTVIGALLSTRAA